jgi:hypothetical protein
MDVSFSECRALIALQVEELPEAGCRRFTASRRSQNRSALACRLSLEKRRPRGKHSGKISVGVSDKNLWRKFYKNFAFIGDDYCSILFTNENDMPQIRRWPRFLRFAIERLQ